ncbi:MAG: hypothetical protein ACYC2R_02635 [Burkholderiales bacterium]
MFSIYGVTGQTFHGPLEQLIQVPGVIRARHARGPAREGEEPGAEILPPGQRTDQDGASYEAAARAYQGTRHRETERGPLIMPTRS